MTSLIQFNLTNQHALAFAKLPMQKPVQHFKFENPSKWISKMQTEVGWMSNHNQESCFYQGLRFMEQSITNCLV